MDLQKHLIKEVRWRILVALNAARPYGTSEHVLGLALHDSDLKVTNSDIRRALEYLSKQQLVTLSVKETWHGELTAKGIDVVDYNEACPNGIGRPQKYW